MRIAVYLGSHDGFDPIYRETAFELGRKLAQQGIGIVYGGASVGTMGALAKGAESAGGEIIGVFPEGFKGRPDIAVTGEEIKQKGLTQMIFVEDFAERKQKMEDLSDCCVILAGSWGTMDEFFAYSTSSQLEFNGGKKLYVLNTKGYYDDLLRLLDKMYQEGFVEGYSRDIVRFCDTVDELLTLL